MPKNGGVGGRFPSLVHLIAEAGVLFNEADEVAAEADGARGGTQEQVGVVLAVQYLHVEFGVAGTVADEGGELVDHGVVEGVALAGDGEARDFAVAHGLEVFHAGGAEVDELAVGVFLHVAASHIDGAAFDEHASPAAPLFAEEGEFAGAVEVFDGDDTHGFASLGVAVAHLGDDATHGDFGLAGEFGFLVELGAAGVAHCVENDAELVEGMS